MRHLIIGNGVAGTTAAENIRQTDGSAEITAVTEELLPFYSRIRLPEFISGSLEEKKMIIHNNSWYQENRIVLISGRKALAVDSNRKLVRVEGNTSLPYDRLLVATGGRAFIPPIPGINRAGVFTLRSMADARRIRDYAEKAGSVLVLGSGVLGLDIGNALRKLGKKITFIECADRLLPRQLDPEGAAILLEKLRALGMDFVMSVKVEEIDGEDSFGSVILDNGSSIAGQMMIISAGMAPDITLFGDLGIKLGRGVPVNDRMETEIPGIFAAGDVAEHEQKVYGIWPAAEEQGKTAGINMAGGSELYRGTTPSNYLSVAGMDIFSAGDIDAENLFPSFAYKDTRSGIYRKLVVRDDAITGGILCGDTKGRKEIISAIQSKRPAGDLLQTLERPDMPWSQIPANKSRNT
jgi:nitrite reductase (NADH) large subunit